MLVDDRGHRPQAHGGCQGKPFGHGHPFPVPGKGKEAGGGFVRGAGGGERRSERGVGRGEPCGGTGVRGPDRELSRGGHGRWR